MLTLNKVEGAHAVSIYRQARNTDTSLRVDGGEEDVSLCAFVCIRDDKLRNDT